MLGMNTLGTHRFSCPTALIVVTFLALCVLSEALQRDKRRPEGSFHLAVSALIKSTLSLFAWIIWRWFGVHSLSTATSYGSSEAYLPTCNGSCNERRISIAGSSSCSHCREPYLRSGANTLILGSVRSTLSILLVALVYSLHTYTDLRARQFVDSLTLYLAFPVTIFGILVLSRITLWRNFPSSFWHATVLQFAGFFITRDAFVGPVFLPWGFLVAFALCNSLWISLADLIYGLHRSSSIHLINAMMFALSFLAHSALFLLEPLHDISHLKSHYDSFASTFQGMPLIEAVRDIAALFIIHQYGAINLGILTSLASTLLIIGDTWGFTEAPSPAYLGCLIAMLGCGILILCREDAGEHQRDVLISARRWFTAVVISSVTLGYIVIVTSRSSEMSSWGSSPTRKESIGLPSSRPDCRASRSSTLPQTQTIGNYTHFDNILLIVFFSHARYDANLDFHREVYADYFPNIVYIGPASRDDKGFSHSYDVLVDSFQSDEDLSDPSFYKMAGRMAHHMLYTALREHDCYDGYLWAPFDTLLNIPRLQQFNQNLFWYHSPWGKPVPNPASGKPAETALDTSRHAPPAMISPDPSTNLTETWRGWSLDWWWGDPHVGVSECMNAFRNVPEDMRANLAEQTNGQTRLIGGSADTLYIPGRHRKTFMDVLGLFLETNCFLEIATPTTVHFVVPPGEPIQFVDHWWIYQPPFNASFVRQKWEEGYEVDTFHTFHWGERGEDGIWRGDHRHVADVRRLLHESARRQGFGDAFPVNLDDGHMIDLE